MRIARLLAYRRSFFAIGFLVFLVFGSFCLLVQNLWPMVTALLALTGLSVAGHDQANKIQNEAAGFTERAEQPAGVNDPFGRCPHCKTLDSHNILRIEGTQTTRGCINCGREWTIDHADPSGPKRVRQPGELAAKLRNCPGCWGAAMASEGKPEGVECTVCHTRWACKPGHKPPRVMAGDDAAAALAACAGCRVAAEKARARPRHWVECQTCSRPVRFG